MLSKVMIAGCVLLTLFVLHTALRIEHANQQSGLILPLSPEMSSQPWTVPELSLVIRDVEHKIAMRRADAFAMEHPGQAIPPDEEFLGEPYSESEQGFIDRTKVSYARYTDLHWWVTNFGKLQYVLAPIALVWAIGNFLAHTKIPLKVISTACAGLAFWAIYLMQLRGY